MYCNQTLVYVRFNVIYLDVSFNYSMESTYRQQTVTLLFILKRFVGNAHRGTCWQVLSSSRVHLPLATISLPSATGSMEVYK